VSETENSRAGVDLRSFVSTLVHELGTPLTALRGSLGLLTEVVEDAAPEVRSLAAIADRNAGKLASLLVEVADYWQLSHPSAPLNREPTDVVDAVQGAIEQVQSLVDQRGIVLDVQTTPVDMTVDPALVRIAIAHLLSYALRVSPKTSTLQVRIETVDSAGATGRQPAAEGREPPAVDAGDATGATGRQPAAENQGRPRPHVVVSVSDGGRVVAAEKAARMFEPFSQVAQRGQDPPMRTGLGLAIAMRIARLHGGSLVFTSTEQGGLFSLRLPV
jgi:signal transduction histidine kinase